MISSISSEIQILFKRDKIIIKSLSHTNSEAETEMLISTPLESFELNVNVDIYRFSKSDRR